MKTCPKCNVLKNDLDYHKDKTRPGGLAWECKLCANQKDREKYRLNPDRSRAASKAWQQKNPEAVKRNNRNSTLRKYGLTQKDYQQMLDKQGGSCAICPRIEPGGNGLHFHIDHDHSTGRVRGLLCSDHNIGLGSFHDSVAELEAAIKYLQQQS